MVIGVLFVVVTGVPYARSVWEAREYLSSAEQSFSRHEIESARGDLLTCVRWFGPFNPYPPQCVELLFKHESEFANRVQMLIELRSALTVTRSNLVGGLLPLAQNFLERTESKLTEHGVSFTPVVRAEPVPLDEPIGAVTSDVLFLAWIGVTIFAIWRGFTSEGKVMRSSLAWGAFFSFTTLSLWLLSLTFRF